MKCCRTNVIGYLSRSINRRRRVCIQKTTEPNNGAAARGLTRRRRSQADEAKSQPGRAVGPVVRGREAGNNGEGLGGAGYREVTGAEDRAEARRVEGEG